MGFLNELRIRHGIGGGRWTTGGGGTSNALEAKVADHTPHVHVSSSHTPADIADDLAAGRKTTATADQIPELMRRFGDLPPMNMAKMQVEGPGNENTFQHHLRDIPRSEMPQLPTTMAELKPFLDHLGSLGVKANLEEMDPRKLQMVQSELSSNKVAKIFGFMENGWQPGQVMLASRENAVADGHHRFAAAAARAMTGKEFKITVLKVDMPIDDLLAAAQLFSGPRMAMSAGLTK